jgi:hypothetical protein
MARVFCVAAAGITVLLAGALPFGRLEAADVAYKAPRHADSRHCHEVRRCGPDGCGYKLVCYRRGCYTGYGCSPLYGGYGPYGGVHYWGAYSWNIWDP